MVLIALITVATITAAFSAAFSALGLTLDRTGKCKSLAPALLITTVTGTVALRASKL